MRLTSRSRRPKIKSTDQSKNSTNKLVKDNKGTVIIQNIVQNNIIQQSKENKGKRKQADPNSWQCNIRKKSRREGKAYVSKKGKLVPAREMKTSCSKEKCKFSCGTVTDEQRQLIFHEFWHTGSKERQSDFIANLVTEEKPKTKKVD